MKYGYQRRLDIPFDEVDSRVRETLKEQGFGVLTEINVNEAFKEKLNEDFRRYKILGACHPPTAYRALSEELEIGLLLPCNVTLWENDDKSTTLSAINAKEMLSVTGRDDLDELANQVNSWLKTAIDAV
ncbi:MAG: DUF302 domain-containing protein [Candidatus Marinimicrobia bacterium]|jgi:uncharacterized protein (DUF302 family)|nr:DUF302 domain-containing protein [Candidatus Neomarinimicrobiota bacterium]MBT3501720.1 DUF302 domain-containing protein [Candidatus Neomarinimicrobiota bacterium]MBT3839695.1 DUF302 domain-containing protein [Candidatus Neomarinimicrobiota bacterium]MBT3999105.1 DUF302 domain-containing protein [Candidatus Neomarinimicrobiota bacterium]MBT4282320.1 DUF302 domain-containing protein [Candidatus Neomarinimicrobiota bacterium]